MDRRKFIESGVLATAAVGLGTLGVNACSSPKKRKLAPFSQSFKAPDGDFRALLLHLGANMWCDWPSSRMGDNLEEAVKSLPERKRPYLTLRCDYEVWRKVTDYALSASMLVSLGDFMLLIVRWQKYGKALTLTP